MVNIEGTAALVTGGQRGLGKAFVRELLDRGARKVYATAREPQPSQDPRIVPVALDVTDAASVRAAVDLAADVSIVINNAGVGGSGPLLQADIDDIRTVFETNLFGAVRVA
jgi:NAD(P)-dependent dehydrogenase (short-subunit alcohol dehydrogenase family)